MAATGKAGETLIADFQPAFYTQNYNGKLWIASLTTASAIPAAATNATPNFIIWNPAGNTTNVVPVRLSIGFAAGTGIAGAIGYTYIPNAGSSVGTGLSMSAFTAGPAVQMGLVGTAYGGSVKFGTAATVTGTGLGIPVRFKWSNLSQGAPITSTAAAYSLYEDFGGMCIIPPGIAWYLDASVAIAETLLISLVAYEAPL
jgi:hypothetical protein